MHSVTPVLNVPVGIVAAYDQMQHWGNGDLPMGYEYIYVYSRYIVVYKRI